MEGGGLLTHPTALQVVLTVLIVMFLVFLMAAGGKAFELMGTGFKRLGRLFAGGAKRSQVSQTTGASSEASARK